MNDDDPAIHLFIVLDMVWNDVARSSPSQRYSGNHQEFAQMITTTRRSNDYDPAKVLGRYVRYEPVDATYRWCETAAFGKGKRRLVLDVAVGICDESDLPGEVAAAARNACVIHPPYVEWPL